MKAIAFTINNGPKELIHWRFNEWINHLITFKPSGEILYMRQNKDGQNEDGRNEDRQNKDR
ncbi:uncharacterized protein ACA1_231390 [Acanthamoeba castellanii str. Neff]|uniref:Uncharacterized protein n=1 Tax=Acanthamoeba castellanii (strain ATCC 30010 / Neff) TaxID=1257118 RepID=L8H8Y4_ACACF|nr:uncharacterized protein ACA1_231390 [Acanthamoeba castellanii str. Neff]ELR21682.1 hypothetical protein ACA1_231390 [Acanthamoeba castellanii str. Neff]